MNRRGPVDRKLASGFLVFTDLCYLYSDEFKANPMKTLIYSIMLTVLLMTFERVDAQYITVTPNTNPTSLVSVHLVGGGILVNNVTGVLAPNASGSFTATAGSGLGISSGIILSTGHINNLDTSSSHFASTSLGTAGDSVLGQLVSAVNTYDAEVLEFDFASVTDTVEFDFVFGSEEYNEYVNSSFNDVFGFFVSGPGYAANTNVALIPGTATPIAINTINNGWASGVAAGPCSNCTYYVDNMVVPNPVKTSYDGLTTVMTLKFPVQPCGVYHFKIAIADVSDRIFDSAVLLGENTFAACPNFRIQHQLSATSPDTAWLCPGGSVTLTAPAGPGFSWSSGQSTFSITVTQPGQYSCQYLNGSCISTLFIPVVMGGMNIQSPVISQNGPTMVSNIVQGPGITYQWSLNGNAIAGATNPTYNPTVNGCYTLTVYEANCEATSNSLCITNTSISEWLLDNINIIPNPAHETVCINTPFTERSVTHVRLMDLSGRQVYAQKTGGSRFCFEVSSLASGMYILGLENSDVNGEGFLRLVVARD